VEGKKLIGYIQDFREKEKQEYLEIKQQLLMAITEMRRNRETTKGEWLIR
jgi:hypothetical protein